jgi:phosphatidylserine decarboxylase
MVRDGYFYALPLVLVALLIGWLASPWWALPALLLAAFFLWFFRDPQRMVPDTPGAIVSPGDGKVTDISSIVLNGTQRTRISIFLNVFNVHVNRAPIGGTIRDLRYQKGKFLNAMNPHSAEENEQNIVVVEGEGHTVIFKQIAGLIARRIVFTKKVGDRVARGERVGLIKFGSRVDVIMVPNVQIAVKLGDHVKGASSILAYAPVAAELASAGNSASRAGAR